MRKIIILLPALLITNFAFSQKNVQVLSPLESYFQKNFDSTIIYHSYGNWDYTLNLYFLAKKDDTIYYYRYFKPFNQSLSGRVGPSKSDLHKKLYTRYYENQPLKFNFKKMDIDDSFFWVFTEQHIGSLWEQVQAENCWDYIDDSSDSLKKSQMPVDDGSVCFFRLLTTDKAIDLSYKNPYFYPISSKNHIRNRVSEKIKLIDTFYKNHKIEFPRD